MTYGQGDKAEAKIENIKLYKSAAEAHVTFDHQTKLNLATFLPGEYNVYNMTAAATVAYLMGVSVDDIREGVANLESIPGRFEKVDINKEYDVVVDYAHTPDALEKLLQTGKEISGNRVILVFGA